VDRTSLGKCGSILKHICLVDKLLLHDANHTIFIDLYKIYVISYKLVLSGCLALKRHDDMNIIINRQILEHRGFEFAVKAELYRITAKSLQAIKQVA
jgi:hypothetical protein